MVLLEISQGCKLGMPRPIMMDWVDLVFFLGAIVATYIAARRSDSSNEKSWLIICFVLILLALNKFLFVDNCIKNALAGLATKNNLYVSRRGIQLFFVILLFLLFILVSVFAVKAASDLHHQWAYIGLLGLIALVILRVISLHQIDGIIYPDRLGIGIGLNWIIEISGSLIIIINAIAHIKKQGSLS